MNCPMYSVELPRTERSGVEIDYCPKCRGAWLDRSDVDKSIPFSATGRGGEGRHGSLEDSSLRRR